MEERAEGAGADRVDDIRLEIDVDRAGDMLAGSSLAEEGAEAFVVLARRRIRDAAVGREALRGQNAPGASTHVLESVQLPAGIAKLAAWVF